MEDPQPRRLLPSPHTTTPQHTWHHSDQVLLELIRGGSDFPQTRMPAFRQTLTDAEITAILEYLKCLPMADHMAGRLGHSRTSSTSSARTARAAASSRRPLAVAW
jgi:hypothetical protein